MATHSGSYPALVTPMDREGHIDWDCFRNLIGYHAAQESDGVVVAGTTGESPTLSMDENREVISKVIGWGEETALKVVAGTGANNTSEAIFLTQNAAKDGARTCLVVVPYYNKPTQEGLYRHFMAVADCAEVEIILYNVPGRTVVDLSNETVLRLAAHPNIIGIKDATGDMERLKGLQTSAGKDFVFLSGDDRTCCEYILNGGHGVISVTANIAPRLMHDLCMAARQGDADTAHKINAQLAHFHVAQGIESNPIPVKWAAWKMGLIPEGIRLPLTPLSEACHPTVREALFHADCQIREEMRQ